MLQKFVRMSQPLYDRVSNHSLKDGNLDCSCLVAGMEDDSMMPDTFCTTQCSGPSDAAKPWESSTGKIQCPPRMQFVDGAMFTYDDNGTIQKDWGTSQPVKFSHKSSTGKPAGYCGNTKSPDISSSASGTRDSSASCNSDSDCTGADTCETSVTGRTTKYQHIPPTECIQNKYCLSQNPSLGTLTTPQEVLQKTAQKLEDQCKASQATCVQNCQQGQLNYCRKNCINKKAEDYIESMKSDAFRNSAFGCHNVSVSQAEADGYAKECEQQNLAPNTANDKAKITPQSCRDSKCAHAVKHSAKGYAMTSLQELAPLDPSGRCSAQMGYPFGSTDQGGVYCTSDFGGAIKAYTSVNAGGGVIDPSVCGDTACCLVPPHVNEALAARLHLGAGAGGDPATIQAVCSPQKLSDGTYKLTPSCDHTSIPTTFSCPITADQTFALFHGTEFCQEYSTELGCYNAAANSTGGCPEECGINAVPLNKRLVGHVLDPENVTEETCIATGDWKNDNCWDPDHEPRCYLKRTSMEPCDISPFERSPSVGKRNPGIAECLNNEATNCYEAKEYDIVAVPQCYLNRDTAKCDVPYNLRLQAWDPKLDTAITDRDNCVVTNTDGNQGAVVDDNLCYEDCKTIQKCGVVPECYLSKTHQCNILPDQRIFGIGVLDEENQQMPMTREKCKPPSDEKYRDRDTHNCWDPLASGIQCYFGGTVSDCGAKDAQCPVPGQYCAEAPGYICKPEINIEGCEDTSAPTSNDVACLPVTDASTTDSANVGEVADQSAVLGYRLYMKGRTCGPECNAGNQAECTRLQDCQWVAAPAEKSDPGAGACVPDSNYFYSARDNCEAAKHLIVKGTKSCTDKHIGEAICCKEPPCWHPLPVVECARGTPVPIYSETERQYCPEGTTCDECAAVGGLPTGVGDNGEFVTSGAGVYPIPGAVCSNPGWCPPEKYTGASGQTFSYPKAAREWCREAVLGTGSVCVGKTLADNQACSAHRSDSACAAAASCRWVPYNDELRDWCTQFTNMCSTTTNQCAHPGQQCSTAPGYTCSVQYNYDTWCDDPPCWIKNDLVKSCPLGPCAKEGTMCENGFICKRQAYSANCTPRPGAAEPPLCWVPQGTPAPKNTCPKLRDLTAGNMSCEYPGQVCREMPGWTCENQTNPKLGCNNPPCWNGPVGALGDCTPINSFHKIPLIGDVWSDSKLAGVGPWVDLSTAITDCSGIESGDMDCSDHPENTVCYLKSYIEKSVLEVFAGGDSGGDSRVNPAMVYFCQDTGKRDKAGKPVRNWNALDNNWYDLGTIVSSVMNGTQTKKPVEAFTHCHNLGQKAVDDEGNSITCQWNDPRKPYPLCNNDKDVTISGQAVGVGMCVPDPQDSKWLDTVQKCVRGKCALSDQDCRNDADCSVPESERPSNSVCSWWRGKDLQSTCTYDVQCQGCWLPDAIPTSCTGDQVSTLCHPKDPIFSSNKYLRLKELGNLGYMCRAETHTPDGSVHALNCDTPPCWMPSNIPLSIETCGTPMILPSFVPPCPPPDEPNCGKTDTKTTDLLNNWCSDGNNQYKQCQKTDDTNMPYKWVSATPQRVTLEDQASKCQKGADCAAEGSVCTIKVQNRDTEIENFRIEEYVCSAQKKWAPINPSTCLHLGQGCTRTVQAKDGETQQHNYTCTAMADEGQAIPMNVDRCDGEQCWVRQWTNDQLVHNTSGTIAKDMVRDNSVLGCDAENLGRIIDAGAQNMICINSVPRVPELISRDASDGKPGKAGEQVYIGGEPQYKPLCTTDGDSTCQGRTGAGSRRCAGDADCPGDEMCFRSTAAPMTPCWAASPKDPIRRCPPPSERDILCDDAAGDGKSPPPGCPTTAELDSLWGLKTTVSCNDIRNTCADGKKCSMTGTSCESDTDCRVRQGDFMRRRLRPTADNPDPGHQFFQCIPVNNKLEWAPYSKATGEAKSSSCCLILALGGNGFECEHPGQECMPYRPNRFAQQTQELHEGQTCVHQPFFLDSSCNIGADAGAVHSQDAKGDLLDTYSVPLPSKPFPYTPKPRWTDDRCYSSPGNKVYNDCSCQFYCTPNKDSYFYHNHGNQMPNQSSKMTVSEWCAESCWFTSGCEANCIPRGTGGCYQPDPPPPVDHCPDWQCEHINHICTVGPGYVCKAQKTPNCTGPLCWVQATYNPPDTPTAPEYSQAGVPSLLTVCPSNECQTEGQLCSHGPGYMCLNSVNTQSGCMKPPCWHRLSSSCRRVHTFDYDSWVGHNDTRLIHPGDCLLVPASAEFPYVQNSTSEPIVQAQQLGADATIPPINHKHHLEQTTLYRYNGDSPIQYLQVNPMTALFRDDTKWVDYGVPLTENSHFCMPKKDVAPFLYCPQHMDHKPYHMLNNPDPFYCCSGSEGSGCVLMNNMVNVHLAPVDPSLKLPEDAPSNLVEIKGVYEYSQAESLVDKLLLLTSKMNDFDAPSCLLRPYCWDSKTPDAECQPGRENVLEITDEAYTKHFIVQYTPGDGVDQCSSDHFCADDTKTEACRTISPYLCLRYGENPPKNTDLRGVRKCPNYTTHPPQPWCEQTCNDCELSGGAAASPGGPSQCPSSCLQWCDCLYQHQYEVNTRLWERLMTLGAGQASVSDHYHYSPEVPTQSAEQIQPQKLTQHTPAPGSVDRLSCQKACTMNADQCDGFIITMGDDSSTCDYFTVRDKNTCPSCANLQCDLPAEKDSQQWVYRDSDACKKG